ncbi:hypothetical protein CEE45_11065 [Candidatus Heimdallarchaeota archaeon B3_Heim]|nr:MAG: hypothetical protein CEE45_11065 [Candidatus Heimdallarchaeota archaeon B3_Heim]
MMYFVMTCDIVHSKEVTNRLEVQEELKTVIKQINIDYSKKIMSPFIIVWGDSFQGVLKELTDFYSIFERLEEDLSFKFRCGLGIGTISTKFSRKSLEMDGLAFHRSRAALKIASDNRRTAWIQSENDSFDQLTNSLLTLLTTLKLQWTNRQKEVIHLRKQGLTYEKIGKKIITEKEENITKQAVSNILKSAHWEEISLAIETLNKLSYPKC